VNHEDGSLVLLEKESGYSMKVLIAGATGLIGSAVSDRLKQDGHCVRILSRSVHHHEKDWYQWNPEKNEIDLDAFTGVDGVINLAGTSIASKRWTPVVQKQILDSRINSTNLIVDAISQLSTRPRVLICASAVGFYGDRGDEILDEYSSAGTGFLAGVCKNWEMSGQRATVLGVRVVCGRIGVVLTQNGGMLKKILPIFKLGLGGKLGSGKQFWSWISLDDLVETFMFCLSHDSLSGPVNFVAPHPITNKEFTKALAGVIKRPAFIAVPAPLLRITLGSMAESLILSSQRVTPNRLVNAGFNFSHPGIEPALRFLLKR
jgi:uncharacterized protein